MKITRDSTLRQVAFIVCTALDRIGVTAILTGGSAATIWSEGAYQSHDCDFIISFHEKDAPAEDALARLGYAETGGTYRHKASPFTLEFPPGPLSVGDEILAKWETISEGDLILHVLTPTDSCRDRLAALYHWKDFSSLHVAISIARKNRVDLGKIKAWSRKEGASEQYAQFARALSSPVKKADS